MALSSFCLLLFPFKMYFTSVINLNLRVFFGLCAITAKKERKHRFKLEPIQSGNWKKHHIRSTVRADDDDIAELDSETKANLVVYSCFTFFDMCQKNDVETGLKQLSEEKESRHMLFRVVCLCKYTTNNHRDDLFRISQYESNDLARSTSSEANETCQRKTKGLSKPMYNKMLELRLNGNQLAMIDNHEAALGKILFRCTEKNQY